MTFDYGYIIMAVSLVGSIANIYKKTWCYILWLFTNFAWIIYNYIIGSPSQMVLNIVYLGMTTWGLIEWRKDDRRKREKVQKR